MTTKQLERPPGTPPTNGLWLGPAWVAVVLIPVFFFIAFALGYVLYDVFGYAPENNDAPLVLDISAAIVALAVSLVPCVAAVVFGRRTARGGDRRGLAPLALGALAGLGLTILTIVTTVGDAVR